jgi:O-succinylbenzoic acid--CoA ligase
MSQLDINPHPETIDWNSSDSALFYNDRLLPTEAARIEKAVRGLDLGRHIFMPTTGTSAQEVSSIKVIALAKEAFLNSARAVNEHLSVRKGEDWLCVLPVFHVGGLSQFARAYLANSRVHRRTWSTDYFLRDLTETKAAYVSLVPTQLFDLIERRESAPNSLKAMIVGGGALAPQITKAAIDLGWPVLTSYGLTEMCSQVATAPLTDANSLQQNSSQQKLKRLSHIEWQTSFEGTLMLRSSSQLSGTLFIDEQVIDQQIIDQQIIGDRVRWQPVHPLDWIMTEDKVTIDSEFIEVLGRGQDFAKILGENVSLLKLDGELETIKLERQWSFRCMTVVVPHGRKGGEIILAADQEPPEELLGLFNSRVLPFERADQIVVVRAWPELALQKKPRTQVTALVRAALQTLDAIPNSTTHVKLKLGHDLETEVARLSEFTKSHPQLKLRLDFNGWGGFEFLRRFSPHAAIDFIEDPEPIGSTAWQMLRQEFRHVRIALDRKPGESALNSDLYDLLVVKPTVENIEPFVASTAVVVTSNMDHPLGHMIAYCEAQRLSDLGAYLNEFHGLRTDTLFEETPYTVRLSELLDLIPSEAGTQFGVGTGVGIGFGFGFDDLLNNESWQCLSSI